VAARFCRRHPIDPSTPNKAGLVTRGPLGAFAHLPTCPALQRSLTIPPTPPLAFSHVQGCFLCDPIVPGSSARTPAEVTLAVLTARGNVFRQTISLARPPGAPVPLSMALHVPDRLRSLSPTRHVPSATSGLLSELC